MTPTKVSLAKHWAVTNVALGRSGLETLRRAVRIFEAMTEQEDIDGLAAEYALGALDAAERRQVKVRRQTDASLSAAIDTWERRLDPLNEQVEGIEPPPHLWEGILSRISSQVAGQSEAAEVPPLRRASGRRWPLVAGASALAATLVLAIAWSLFRQPLRQEQTKLDCGKLYKDFWQTRDPENYAQTPPERLAGVSRMALRAYDACQAGDEQDAKALLARLIGRRGERSSPHDQHRAAAETKQRLAGRV
jgi:hypothetical protein